MGHIELAAPVAHIWYFKGIPSRIGLMLDITPRNLEKVIYFASYIVTDKGTSELSKYQVLSEKEYHDAEEKYGRGSFKAEMGAEAIEKLLREVDVDKLTEKLKKELEKAFSEMYGIYLNKLEQRDYKNKIEISANLPYSEKNLYEYVNLKNDKYKNNTNVKRIVIDYIAGQTDKFFLRECASNLDEHFV